jgi:membrane-bound lytic murein transglycosylase B
VLYEDDVVAAVAAYLHANGWEIESTALATQHGDDIVAMRDGERLIVEAKGEGSSKAHTSRYGKAFNQGQVSTHVVRFVDGIPLLLGLAVAYAAPVYFLWRRPPSDRD